MPVYLFWGEDDFALTRAARQLREKVVDPAWAAFNFEKIPGDRPDAVGDGLLQVMTPPFGMGGRLIWLSDTSLCQHCPDDLLAQLDRTLNSMPSHSHLLLTSAKKPDKRLRSTKLIEERGQFREFSPIPPWKNEEILQKTQKSAREVGVDLTPSALQFLAQSVGNQSRQLWSELEKLALYAEGQNHPLDIEIVASLVSASNYNSLQLAEAIRLGNCDRALALLKDLLQQNEPALRIVATLVGQFRVWSWVRLSIDAGEREEKAIAAAAEIANPKRIYFIRKEIQSLSSRQLLATFPILCDLEWGMKRGADSEAFLAAKVIELCHCFQ